MYLTGNSEVALDRLQLVVLLLHLFDILYLFDGFLYRHTEVIEVDGFCGEVEGTVVHRLADVSHITVGRDHDTLQGRILHLVDLREQCQSVHLWHVDVAEDDIKVLLLKEHCQCFQSVVGKLKLILAMTYLTSEILGEQQLEIHLVVYTKYLYWHNSIFIILILDAKIAQNVKNTKKKDEKRNNLFNFAG